MLTLKQLLVNRGRPGMHRAKVNPTNSYRMTGVVPIPMANSLAVRFTFNALTDPDADTYTTLMIFHGLKMSTTKDSEHPLGFEVRGRDIYTSRPSFQATQTGVACECLDYYFTWGWYNAKNTGNNAGNDPEPYPNYDSNYSPHRNRLAIPGLCKHLCVAAVYLSEQGFLTT